MHLVSSRNSTLNGGAVNINNYINSHTLYLSLFFKVQHITYKVTLLFTVFELLALLLLLMPLISAQVSILADN